MRHHKLYDFGEQDHLVKVEYSKIFKLQKKFKVIKSEITKVNVSEFTQLIPLPILSYTILYYRLQSDIQCSAKFLKETFFSKQNVFQTVARFYNEQF